jgi:hypothetical protein
VRRFRALLRACLEKRTFAYWRYRPGDIRHMHVRRVFLRATVAAAVPFAVLVALFSYNYLVDPEPSFSDVPPMKWADVTHDLTFIAVCSLLVGVGVLIGLWPFRKVALGGVASGLTIGMTSSALVVFASPKQFNVAYWLIPYVQTMTPIIISAVPAIAFGLWKSFRRHGDQRGG